MTQEEMIASLQKKLKDLSDYVDQLWYIFRKKTGPSSNDIQGSDIQSTNFQTGVAGWHLDPDGNLEANNGNFRGDITGATGTFSGTVTVGSLNIPDSVTASSVHVDSSGNTWWGANVASGYAAAVAYILATGQALFTTVTITGATTSFIQVPLSKPYTAGEALSAGDAVFLEDNSTDLSQVDTATDAGAADDTGRTGNRQKLSQSFNESRIIVIDKVKVYLKKTGAPADNVEIAIQADSAGSPSGSDLATGTIAAASLTTSLAEYAVSLSSPYTTAASTTYWIVVRRSGALSDVNYYSLGKNSANTSTYANGLIKVFDAGGSTWSGAGLSYDYQVKLTTTTVAGRVYRTSAATVGLFETFIGFAQSSTAQGAAAIVFIMGEVPSLSGLNAGSQYYLSNTKGAIANTPGSNTRKVGIATSSSTLLITNIW